MEQKPGSRSRRAMQVAGRLEDALTAYEAAAAADGRGAAGRADLCREIGTDTPEPRRRRRRDGRRREGAGDDAVPRGRRRARRRARDRERGRGRAVRLLDGVTDYQDTFVLTTAAQVAAVRALALVLDGDAVPGPNRRPWRSGTSPTSPTCGSPSQWPPTAARPKPPISPPGRSRRRTSSRHWAGCSRSRPRTPTAWPRRCGATIPDRPAMRVAAAPLLADRLTGERARTWAVRANPSTPAAS